MLVVCSKFHLENFVWAILLLLISISKGKKIFLMNALTKFRAERRDTMKPDKRGKPSWLKNN